MVDKSEPLFNAGASIYDSFTFLHRPAELTAEKALLLPGQKVLDIACGSGWTTMAAARIIGETGHVTGIDIADKLLDIAMQKAASNELVNITYLIGDVHKLAFENNMYDAVLCASSLFLFNDLNEVLHESYRVLKTGGIMIFSIFEKDVFQPLIGLINEHMLRHGKKVLLQSPISITDSPEKCKDIFTDAGLGNVEITKENCVLHFLDKEECWRQISGSLIVRPRLSGLSPDEYRKLKEETLLELEQHMTSQGISLDMPVLFCIVRKF